MKWASGASLAILAISAGATQLAVSARATKQNGVGVTVVTTNAAPFVKPEATTPIVIPAKTTPLAAPSTLKLLPPLDLSDMKLWNWGGKWMGSQWGNGNSSIGWSYDHINQPGHADTIFTLDSNGAPELQAMNGIQPYQRGLWETDVNLPNLREGVVVAPLWIYDPSSRDEVDFELPGKNGLDVTLHASVGGIMQQSTVRLFSGQDMSGQRHRFGIKLDEQAGYVEMYVDNRLVKRWDRGGMSFFVSHPMKPLIEMWAANSYFASWAGTFAGFAANESMTMNVHGYDYTAIP